MGKHIGSFSAVDAQGKRYTIHIYEMTVAANPFDAHSPLVPGSKVLYTSDQVLVSRRAQGQYVMHAGSDVPLKSDDPNAP